MKFISEGTARNSYKIEFLGIKIRFRNIFKLKNNKIIIIDDKGICKLKRRIRGLKVKFKGANSTIKLHYPHPKFENTTIECGDNATVIIGESQHKISNSYFGIFSMNGKINIGDNVCIRSACFVVKEKPELSINIGNNCLIASNVKFWTTDFHTIIDKATLSAINPPASINIGNNCWICEDVTISKGVSLADYTVVGTKSYVTKSFDKTNVIIGGIPAKIIKENISWSNLPYNTYNSQQH